MDPLAHKGLKNKHKHKNIYKHMIAISKNVYINKLDDIVNEYNNSYRRTIKMKPIEVVKDNTYILTILKKLMIKILHLKLVIM